MTRRDLFPMLALAPGLLAAWWYVLRPTQDWRCTTMVLLSSEHPICDNEPFPHRCTPECEGTLHRDTLLTDVAGPVVVAQLWRAGSPVTLLDLQPQATPQGVPGFRMVFVYGDPTR